LLWHGDAFTLGGYFGARYDRWSLFADAYGGFLNESVTESVPTRFCNVQVGATARLKPVIADVAVGYELVEYRVPAWRRPISLGVYLGTRIVHLGVDLEASAGVVGGIQGGRSVSDSFTTATPMLGVRWEIPVHDQVSFDFRGDLGGLPGGSRLNWNFVGDVRYRLRWLPWGGDAAVARGGLPRGRVQPRFRRRQRPRTAAARPAAGCRVRVLIQGAEAWARPRRGRRLRAALLRRPRAAP